MNVFLAAIIFTFFAVFAPNSHGDRPLLHAEHTHGEIQYSSFKLPIARLHSSVNVERTVFSILICPFPFTLETPTATPVSTVLKSQFNLHSQILTFASTPFIFAEILQV